MRSLSFIAILIALAIAAYAWQKLIDENTSLRDPPAATERSSLDKQFMRRDLSTECDASYTPGSECASLIDNTEQGEMRKQRREAYETMLQSFDAAFSNYQDQTREQK